MKCPKCQTEYEGNFCPICGLKNDSLKQSNNSQSQPVVSGYGSAPNYTEYLTDNSHTKVKKPIYKRWWFWVIIVVVFLVIISSFGSSDEPSNSNATTSSIEETNVGDSLSVDEENKQDKEPTKPKEPAKPKIPVEYKNALIKAESYAKTMHMSKAAIYEQLTSEYGERFPKDAAQYAIDNLNSINWNENALKKAQSYQENMHMSKDAIYDQLVSEYGEKFTPEQARYAVDHLQ